MHIIIEHGDVNARFYQECLDIRYEVLRKPLGLGIADHELESDKETLHVIAYVDGQPAGTVSLRSGRLRQMAVRDNFQGLGIGVQLVHYLEQIAKGLGLEELGIDARYSAISFYEKLGYHCCSDFHETIGIPHRYMIKTLE